MRVLSIISLVLLIYLQNVLGEERRIPDQLKLGIATSAYQTEGAWNVSDKSPSIWDDLSHTQQYLIADDSNGDIAGDSYHRYKEDVQLLKSLNVDFYRFSISWSRLLPNGFNNKISEDGLRFYNDLIDELIANDIEPVVTLYHWDLPLKLSQLGGWTNPLIADWFEDYARVAFRHFGDRVKKWVTINEASQICLLGYGNLMGMLLAPGYKMGGYGDYLCSKYVVLAHARAYRLYDSEFRSSQGGQIGITNFMFWMEAATDSSKDIAAAQRAHDFMSGIFLDPIFDEVNDYPESMRTRVSERSRMQNYTRSRLPTFTDEEKRLVKGSSDFFGLNHYTSMLVSDHEYSLEDGEGIIQDAGVLLSRKAEWAPTMSGWFAVNPDGFRKLLVYLKRKYNSPEIWVTENGYSSEPGLQDINRIDFYTQYINQMLLAMSEDKVNVTHYTAWTLYDNFEWVGGYSARFGLYEMDYKDIDLKRTERLSAAFYREVTATRKLRLDYQPTPIEMDTKGDH